MSVEAVSPLATWTVLCQARKDEDGSGSISVSVGPRGALGGDPLSRYLALGSTPGTPIDDVAAIGPTGRYLVVQRGGVLSLVDSFTNREAKLADADARRDASPFLHHRAVAFAEVGNVLVYLRRRGKQTRVVVRQLSSGQERELEPGAGEPWRIDVDPTGQVVVLSVVTEDSNENHRLSWPVKPRKEPWPCHGPISTFPSPSPGPDGVTPRILPVSGGPAVDVPGLVGALGTAVLARTPDGALRLREGRRDQELAPADCGARVLYADAKRKLALVACAGMEGRPPLELVSPAGRVKLDADVAYLASDHAPSATRRMLAVYPGSDAALLDLDQQKLTRLAKGDAVLALDGPAALVRRGRHLLLARADGSTQKLAPQLPELPHWAVGLHHVAVTPVVVRVATGEVLGQFRGVPLAVSPEGRVLVAEQDGDGEHLAQGPLRWIAPEPPGDAGTH